MLKRTLPLVALAIIAAAPVSAQAQHRGWLMPSDTVLSGRSAWVGFDAAVSTGVFIADYEPLRTTAESLVVTAPDGSHPAVANLLQAAHRTTFDVEVNQRGTWKIANASAGVAAIWTLNGAPGGWRGPAGDLAANIPAGAENVVSAPNANRLETFVTLGAPTLTVFEPTGVGIEMVPVTHPNDLVSGEPGVFQFLRDGRPYADADVVVAHDGLQYRDNPEELALKTDAEGRVTIPWPSAGLYWVNVNWRDPNAPPPAPRAPRREGPRAEGPRGPGGPGGGRGPGGPPVASARYTAVLQVLP